MQPVLLGVSIALLSVICWPTPYALADDTKVARGTVVAIAGSSLTVKVRDQEMVFSVDAKTFVEARGAGTKARAAAAAGKSGPKLSEVIKTGESVEVNYHDMGGKLHAARIRGISAASAAAATTTTTTASEKTASGTVKSVSATSMTISGSSGGGATFTQSYTIDPDTKVIGKGLGTAAAAKGGRTTITELVHAGDSVTVSYSAKGSALHASEVRVVTAAPRPPTKH